MARHKLPSGIEIDLDDHHAWRGQDVQDVWESWGTVDATGAQAVLAMRLSLVQRMVTWSSSETWPIPFTPEQTLKMDADDYVKVINLILPAYDLANGRSVIPRFEDYADPTRPTADSSE